MSDDSIPFNRPTILGEEISHIERAIARGHTCGDGHYTALCNDLIAELAGTGPGGALITHSCTAALEMAALLCDVGPGDEVIVPSFTFVSTASAIAMRGATPVFVDVRPDTLNIDPKAIEVAIGPRTRAIFAVHYAGVIADMNAINAIAEKHNLIVVEDAAQAIGSRYLGRPAGSLGTMATFSFHETKNLNSGEGGAIVLNSQPLLERAEIIREKGTNRKQFFRGMVDKYSWVSLGSSFLPGEIVAAFLYPQLRQIETITRRRLDQWARYDAAFRGTVEVQGFATPFIPSDCEHNAHMYYLMAPSAETRSAFIARMKERNITTPFHYVPLHSTKAGLQYGKTRGDLSVTNDISARIVRLPLFYAFGDEQDRVIEAVLDLVGIGQ